METARDSIKYVRPVYSKTFNGNELVDKTEDFNRLYEDADELNDINTDGYRRPIYESTEDRISQELATVLPTLGEGSGALVTFTFASYADAEEAKAAYVAVGVTAAEAEKKANELYKASKKWGVKGEKYLDGYATVYYGTDQNVVAIQDKRTGAFFTAPDFKGLDVSIVTPTIEHPAVITVDGDVEATFNIAKYGTFDAKKLRVFARYDSEDDFNGDYLGEVEIKMSDYFFAPRPTTIGVTWSQMSEIVLDTSFNVSAEEYLVTYASQAIKMHLDYQAVKMAYRVAKTNPSSYQITFDAAYNYNNGANLEGYVHNAETFPLAIDTVGDNMLNDINRGGVTRLVTGPSAGTYMKLCSQFSPKGAVQNQSVHQIGELAGIPVFKAPQSIIPTNEVLTVWKNPENEADIAIAFGTLVPFFSTGIIQRKNLYKEAALATYGDWHVINKRYLSLITIDNLKDLTA